MVYYGAEVLFVNKQYALQVIGAVSPIRKSSAFRHGLFNRDLAIITLFAYAVSSIPCLILIVIFEGMKYLNFIILWGQEKTC